MAVIQDLPAELLYRILDLMASTESNPYDQAATRRSFARTSLVARSWRGPSQYLLASTLHTLIGLPVWDKYLELVSNASSSTVSTVQHLEVRDSKRSADGLALLQQRDITVQELEIKEDVLHLNSAHVRLFQGVRRLTLWGSVKLVGNLGGGATLRLEALHVQPGLHELPAFMLPLSTVPVAPRLTRLTIGYSYSRFSNSLNAPLQDLAPQLIHLRLVLEPSLPLHGDGFDLDRFLSVCTSLTSLQLDTVTLANLQNILLSTRPPLSLLNVDLSLRSVEEEDELMTVQLAGVFDLPCMAKLKRWRMSGGVYEAAAWREISESAMEGWRAACQERGIEPRGAERYFTD